MATSAINSQTEVRVQTDNLQATCNVFRFLKNCNIPVSFKREESDHYVANFYNEGPSVKVYRELSHNPFSKLKVEKMETSSGHNNLNKISKMVFLVLEKAWQNNGERLSSIDIQFGLSKNNELVVDVVKPLSNEKGHYTIPQQQLIIVTENENKETVDQGLDLFRRGVNITVVDNGIDALMDMKDVPNSVFYTRSSNVKDFLKLNTTLPIIYGDGGVYDGLINAISVLALSNPYLYMQLNVDKT